MAIDKAKVRQDIALKWPNQEEKDFLLALLDGAKPAADNSELVKELEAAKKDNAELQEKLVAAQQSHTGVPTEMTVGPGTANIDPK